MNWKINYNSNKLLLTNILLYILLIHLVRGDEKWVWSKDRPLDSDTSASSKKVTVKSVITEEDLLDLQVKPKKSTSRIDKFFKDDFEDDDDEDDRFDSKKARYEVKEQYEYINGRPVSTIRKTTHSPPPYSLKRKPPTEQYIPSASGVSVKRQQDGSPQESLGILTGPVPSWEKPVLQKNGDPTRFERCRCSFSFNCKSPGIHFGNCDQGKQYCCFNDFEEANNAAAGSTNIERYDRLPSILIGPDGPRDDIRRGFKSYIYPPEVGFKSYLYPESRLPPSVLAGPGGPVDGVGRSGLRPRVGPLLPSPSTPPLNFGMVDRVDFDRYGERRSSLPILPQKPVLPPYVGLHNDYRSS